MKYELPSIGLEKKWKTHLLYQICFVLCRQHHHEDLQIRTYYISMQNALHLLEDFSEKLMFQCYKWNCLLKRQNTTFLPVGIRQKTVPDSGNLCHVVSGSKTFGNVLYHYRCRFHNILKPHSAIGRLDSILLKFADSMIKFALADRLFMS